MSGTGASDSGTDFETSTFIGAMQVEREIDRVDGIARGTLIDEEVRNRLSAP
jgi:hypothetical protein